MRPAAAVLGTQAEGLVFAAPTVRPALTSNNPYRIQPSRACYASAKLLAGSMRAFVLGFALALAGCGGQSQTSTATADAGAESVVQDTGSGAGGANTGIGFDSSVASGVKQCAWPVKASTDAAPELQGWCDGAGSNPSACAALPPPPGSDCAPSGIVCVYKTDPALTVSRCNSESWQSTGYRCSQECGELASGLEVPVPVSVCGSVDPSLCAGAAPTNFERVVDTLQELSECCGNVYEGAIQVVFENGCARKVISDQAVPEILGCYARALAGRQLSCAAALPCASVTWSSVR